MASDLRVELDPILEAFGVPAVVTRPAPDDAPITTSAIWLTVDSSTGNLVLDPRPGGLSVQRLEQYRAMAIPKSDVPTVPKGTRIDAAETAGGPTLAWRGDGALYLDADHHRVFVVPETEP